MSQSPLDISGLWLIVILDPLLRLILVGCGGVYWARIVCFAVVVVLFVV